MKIQQPLENNYVNQARLLGLDEAGRGPIAGPLVVAGVIFPVGYQHEELYDSKKLSEKKRNELYEVILKDALYIKIEIVSEEVIDFENIYRATQNAMVRIVEDAKATFVLSDAMPLPMIHCEFEAVVKGDQKSFSIAAASILAKVTRDRLLYELDQLYPMYGFKNHKGYPTKAHLAALDEYGVIPCHRKSYKPVQLKLQYKLEL